jgi:hypothetical protein
MGMTATALAQASGLPGMCNGRTDANVQINAMANGRSTIKYVLNIETDAAGQPTGTLILGQGKERMKVEEWCRVWQHQPGQPYGSCSADIPEGAVTAHAVGILARGEERTLVRTDIRQTDEGTYFRVRYRILPSHDGHDGDEGGHDGGSGGGHDEDEGGCEDETWVRVPAEGWSQLHTMKVRSAVQAR